MPDACVCQHGQLGAALREDLDRYVFTIEQQHGLTGRLAPIRVGLLSQGMWATAAYRVNHQARHHGRSRLVRVLSSSFYQLITALTGIHLNAEAHIAPGLKIPHGGRIEVGAVRVGRNCDIYQGVTLGGTMSTAGDPPSDPSSGPAVPTLGNRVWVGPGAVIAGRVTVADDASVGANSLLVRDVPERGVVLGVPARLVSRRGSFEQVIYRRMDADDERKAALAAES